MLPPRVEEATRRASQWVRNLTDDWVIVKQEILNELDDEHRAMFTRRNSHTKEIAELNSLEVAICELWHALTGVRPILRIRAERKNIKWWKPT